MIYHNYKILEIKGADHNKYGKCLMVYANPVTKKATSFEFSTIVDKRTIKFLFPFKYLQELQRIANTFDYWTPCEDWYVKNRIYDGRIKKYVPIYEHVNLELDRLDMLDGDDDTPNLNDGDESSQNSIIPNIEYKWSKLIEDWESEIEKPDTEYGYNRGGGPAEFVDNECSEKDGFFSWLFDNDTISDASELTEEQDEAYSALIEELTKRG